MKKLFLSVLPLLALGMTACGGGSSSSSASSSSQTSSASSVVSSSATSTSEASSESSSAASSDSSSSTSSSEAAAPTAGFHVKLTSGSAVSYIAAADTGTESYGKHVYATESAVALAANDVFCMFDGSTGSSFNCKDAGTLYLGEGIDASAFTYSADYITVNTAGSYYIELQLAFDNNSYYIHL